MKHFLLVAFTCAFFLWGCTPPPTTPKDTIDTEQSQVDKDTSSLVEEDVPSSSQVESQESENTETTVVDSQPLSESSSLEDFRGKPSVLVFGGTYCPHCRTAVPVFEEKIWTPYNEQAHIWVNVIDQKRFDVDKINQGFNPNIVYDDIAPEPCRYVPSWIVLDAELNPVLTSCGTEKSIDDMEQALLDLF